MPRAGITAAAEPIDKKKSRLLVGGARAHRLQPHQGPLSRRRLHQGRSDRRLRRPRRGPAAAPARPAGDAEALSRRRRGQVLLREAEPETPSRLGGDGADLVGEPQGRDRLHADRRPAEPRLVGEPGEHRAAHLAGPRRGPRPPRLARLRPRPRRARRHRRLRPRRPAPARLLRPARPRQLREDLRLQGHPPPRAAERHRHLRRVAPVRQGGRRDLRGPLPRRGRLPPDEDETHRPRPHRLEPERPPQDDRLRLHDPRQGAPDRLDPAGMGGGRGRRRVGRRRRARLHRRRPPRKDRCKRRPLRPAPEPKTRAARTFPSDPVGTIRSHVPGRTRVLGPALRRGGDALRRRARRGRGGRLRVRARAGRGPDRGLRARPRRRG